MRTGQNPSKSGIPAYSPKQLGVALLVYIPFLAGYFKNSLEILKLQITSLYKYTDQEFDLLVFDNGSCAEVIEVLNDLQKDNYIEWLILSNHNLGKVGAWNWIFGSMPNKLICYADSDVLFRRGWLETSLKILKAFPKAGMISAQPTFHDVLEGEGKAHLTLDGDGGYRIEDHIPRFDIVEEYCLGIGADGELAAQFHNMTLQKITNESENVSAVIGATHMQFLIPRGVSRQITPLPASRGLYRAETIALDRKVDELGYLHLSTLENHVMHMGNTINEHLLEEVQDLDRDSISIPTSDKLVLSKKSFLFRLALRLSEIPSINDLFLRIYDFLYRVLYIEKQ